MYFNLDAELAYRKRIELASETETFPRFHIINAVRYSFSRETCEINI